MSSTTLLTRGPGSSDSLITTTLEAWWQNKLEDNIFSKHSMLSLMYDKKMSINGGASILVPIMYEANTTATWFTDYDIIDTTPQDGMTQAQEPWRNVAASISISDTESNQNSGKHQSINMLTAKTQQAETTIRDQITTSLFSTTTGTKAINALYPMMDITSTIHGINSTTYSWWQANTSTMGSFTTNGLSYMRTAYSTIENKNPGTAPDMLITTPTVKDYYEGSLTNQLRYTDNESADGGFKYLLFKNAKVVADSQCTSGTMYMFNSDDLKIVLNSNADFRKTEFVKPANQLARVAQVYVTLNLVTKNRRRLHRIIGITV